MLAQKLHLLKNQSLVMDQVYAATCVCM